MSDSIAVRIRCIAWLSFAGHSATESGAGEARELAEFEEVSQNQKPPHSYNKLIRLSILNSPQRRRTLSQIYKWIEDKFPFYKTAGTSWKVCTTWGAVTKCTLSKCVSADSWFVSSEIFGLPMSN